MKKIIFIFLFFVLLILTSCEKEKNVYEVKFLVDEGVVSTQQIVEGESAILPNSPEKIGYTFIGWDKEVNNIQNDLEVNAIFETIKYSIKYYDGEMEITGLTPNEYTIESGNVELPKEMTKEGYVFLGWSPVEYSGSTIINSFSSNDARDKNFIALWKKEEPKTYNITFEDGFGNVIDTQTVIEGESAKPPKDLIRTGYNFVGWNHDTSEVSSDLVVTAIWELIKFSIKYYDGDTELTDLSPKEYTVESDASINLPNAPEKEGFEFVGWYCDGVRVVTFFSSDACDKVFEANYQEKVIEEEKKLELPNDGDYLFLNIKKVPHGSGNGTYVYQPDFTGLDVPSTSVTEYEWSSLTPDVVTISQWSSISVVSPGYGILKATLLGGKKCIIYAVVKANADGVFISSIEEANTKKTYVVTFTDSSNKIIEKQVVQEGKNAVLPTPPEKKGYTFVGWSKDHFNIQSDVTIKATYIKGTSDFLGKKVSILGDSISTFKGYVPDGYPCFYPYPTSDFGDVNQTWWMQVINNLGMSLHKNNSYSGSCVSSGTGNSSTVTDSRLIELVDGNERPDIILIFMGSNDCASKYVELSTFTSSYKTMIEKIKVLCPDAKIYLFTLPVSNMYSEENRDNYNEVIRENVKEFSLNLVELDEAFTDSNVGDNLLDSAHHNKAGMKRLSEVIINEMLKIAGIE